MLDACVLYPPVLRAILTGLAARGLYAPLWSDRLLEEWARATVKLGAEAEAQSRADASVLRAAFPRAMVAPQRHLETRLMLPDPGDVHVLATAIAGSADAILTFNAADFPRHLLAAEGIARRDPDGWLWEMQSHHPADVAAALEEVRAGAERRAQAPVALKALLKRLRLNRLAKAVQDG